jgi:hypothetical protein
MAVLKLNKSGKSILMVDDTGKTFITSIEHLNRLIQGKFACGFLLLTRLHGDNAANRFPQSPLWDPSTGTVSNTELKTDGTDLTTTVDALSVKKRSEVLIKDVML